MALTIRRLRRSGVVCPSSLIKKQVAAIGLGIVGDEILLGLDYAEDSTADVDMNITMTDDPTMAEIQDAAEKVSFSRDRLAHMLDIAEKRLQIRFAIQLQALDGTLHP